MANGVYPVNYFTSVGQTRLLIPDTAVDAGLDFIFTDDQITALLALFNGNVKRAAAQAKDIIATDQLLLIRVVRTDDLSVDGAKVAAELREQAKSLRAQADKDDEGDTLDYFAIVFPDRAVYPEAVPVWGRHLVEIAEVEDHTPWA
jgi:hypothetical protein